MQVFEVQLIFGVLVIVVVKGTEVCCLTVAVLESLSDSSDKQRAQGVNISQR